MHNVFSRPVLLFVFGALVVTACLFGTYVSVQQVYRTGLDDPQIQLAEDGALVLQKGGVPADVVSRNTPLFEMSQSLAPWVAVYDNKGLTLESSATLNNAPPKLPLGLFDETGWSKAPMYLQNNMRETRFTWQPEAGVRQAVVLVKVSDTRFVASGRNMRDVEQRIEHLGEMLFLGWIVTLVALLVVTLVGSRVSRTKN